MTARTPSKGICEGMTLATLTAPTIGGTEVNINVAFDSIPTREEYTTIGKVENTDTAGARTMTTKESEASE